MRRSEIKKPSHGGLLIPSKDTTYSFTNPKSGLGEPYLFSMEVINGDIFDHNALASASINALSSSWEV